MTGANIGRVPPRAPDLKNPTDVERWQKDVQLYFQVVANDAVSAAVDAAAAAAAAAAAQATADAACRTFYQTTAPTDPEEGDLWVDTDDAQRGVYRRTSGAWVYVCDQTAFNTAAAIAGQGALATKSFVVYRQTSAPSSPITGDLWVDTDDSARGVYRWSGSAWDYVSDQTAFNTAAAIAGQGQLATMDLDELPFGVNAVVNSGFENDTYGWVQDGTTDSGLSCTMGRNVTLSGQPYFGGRNVAYSTLVGTPANGTFWFGWYQGGTSLAQLQRFALPVKAGDRIFASMMVSLYRCAGYIRIRYYDKAGSFISSEDVGNNVLKVASGGPNGNDGDPANLGRLYGFGTAPANAAFAHAATRAVCDGSANPYMFHTDAMLCVVGANQTAPPAYNPGGPVRGAVETAQITANAVSQAAVATTAGTLNFSTYSSPPAVYDTLQSVTLTTTGGGALISFSAEVAVGNNDINNIPFAVHYRVKRDGTTIYETNGSLPHPHDSTGGTTLNAYIAQDVVAFSFLDAAPSAASHTYLVEGSIGQFQTGTAKNRTLSVLELKR